MENGECQAALKNLNHMMRKDNGDGGYQDNDILKIKESVESV